MAAPRNVLRDEESAAAALLNNSSKEDDDSPTGKRLKSERFPVSRWELAAFFGVFLIFSTGLFCIYLTMPATEYGKLKIPRSISDLRLLKDNIATYATGALFGVKGVFLVVFNATAGACSCFFLSKLIGRPLVSWLWPDKLRFFQAEIAKRRDKLLNYMLFLRITPTLPNLFINLASPIVDIPFHVFFLATFVGLIPASYITVKAGLALGDLRSVKDLYDFKTLSVLFLIGLVSIFPTLLKKKKIYE
ncbi:hypothetical protein ES332_A02G074100v1 [Gossypium tomentosum]|uniref:VTT domain-containing protein n=1 Tax=Gossypium tomentosum TaxID=34277 RepID=A0A5D2RE55_GOSTO|nr:hypothetical protein ES332_A02G074100v1 [Gossypium tomentosum]